MTADQHCFVAGTGVVSSIARGTRPFFDALCAGRTGLRPLRGLDPDRYRIKNAYEIHDDATPAGAPGRATEWLCDAVAQALDDAGLDNDLSGVPVFVGTGLRELRSLEAAWTGGPEFPLSRLHFGPALRERFGAATTYTVNNACSASLYALGLAADLLTHGGEDVVVVAGVDSLTASMFGLMDRVQPPTVERVEPFDRNRRGSLMGEGAAAVVLTRHGPGSARLRSVALNCDARNETAPDPTGIAAAMTEAHRRARVAPADVDVVIAHGTGTVLNDRVEAAALTGVFTDHGASPLVTGIKSATGHTSGASALMSLVAAVEALRTGRVPPVTGLREPDPEAAHLRLVTGGATAADVTAVQVDAFGFGGVNAVAVLDRAVS